MPAKRVSEMSELEKRRYSLSARMFHTVLLISVILFAISVVVSYVMFIVTVEKNPSLQNLFDMQNTSHISYLLQYALVMLLVTVVLAVILVQRLKRDVVRPINELAGAAEKYMRHEYDEETGASYFSDLDIRTGDEIENLSETMAKMETDMKGFLANLAHVTAEKERIGTELNLATQIQTSMLPTFFPPFPDRTEFDLFADMKPAKEVGGDFYDFFLLDKDHLALVIADVSGKGVPAALFMMASKIMINNRAMMGGTPKDILSFANRQICANNALDMFITVWIGILELSTGTITASSAGHEYPVICRNGGNFELFKDPHGFVIGGYDNMKYRDYEIHLNPGDTLFIYTDGVTEATNAENELFGTERLLSTLNEMRTGSSRDILNHVHENIGRFVLDAPQFDDITMLSLRYNGGGIDMKEFTVRAEVEKLAEVNDFVSQTLEAYDCPMKVLMQISLAVEEIFVNIANYAYAADGGNATIRAGIEKDTNMAVITFVDRGRPYDPTAKEDPDVTLSADEREIGGLGIYMVKKTMDDVSYSYTNGCNVLTLKKKL
ncbi:MAG: SpoIIE family protein phosphatase [Eubacterium sp.]|nr:SpoIIE family protein phosphatase [Eubacterium sp.]